MKNNKTKAVAAGIIGVVVGGIVGLMFAPNSGVESRKKILKSVKGIKGKR